MLDKILELNKQGKIKKTSEIYLGEGVSLNSNNFEDFKIKKIAIPHSKRNQHFGCIGTTRIGKSKLIAHMACQDILSGFSVGIFDPKGDEELLSYIISACVQAGRLEEFIFISPIHPDFSLKINPLHYYYIMDELIYHVIAGIQTKEKFFFDVAREITTVIVSYYVLQALAKGEKKASINFFDIKQKTDYEALQQIVENVKFYKNHSNPEVRDLAEEVIIHAEEALRSGTQYFSEVAGSLRTVLTSLTSSVTGRIIGKAKTNEIIKRLETNQPVIFYVCTGDQVTRFTAHSIARIFVSSIQSAVGRILLSGKKLNPPLALYFDEGDTILYWGIESLFNKGGGANLWIHFFTQSFSQMIDAIGEQKARSIIDNISTWVYMRVNDNATAQYIEESSPYRIIWKVIPSVGDAKASFSLREEEERVVLAERVKKLKPRYYYLRYEGEFYKGIVPFMSEPFIKIQLPDVRAVSSESLENMESAG
jgi:hypothetical protein